MPRRGLTVSHLAGTPPPACDTSVTGETAHLDRGRERGHKYVLTSPFPARSHGAASTTSTRSRAPGRPPSGAPRRPRAQGTHPARISAPPRRAGPAELFAAPCQRTLRGLNPTPLTGTRRWTGRKVQRWTCPHCRQRSRIGRGLSRLRLRNAKTSRLQAATAGRLMVRTAAEAGP